MKEELALLGGYVGAGLGPLAATAALSPLRDKPMAVGVVVLVLIVVIATSAALAGPTVGAVATVTAALSYDFLLIRPYGVLKFEAGRDLWPVAVLLVVGAAIAAISRNRWPPSARASASPTSGSRPTSPPPSRHIQRVVQQIEEGVDPRDLISAVQAELTSLLLARSCRFEAGAGEASEDTIARPRLERDGTVSGIGRHVELPLAELDLPVRFGPHHLGRFVLDPTPGVPIPFDRRVVAVILTDHLAAAIGSRHKSTPPLT